MANQAQDKAYNRVADMILKEDHYDETKDNPQAQLRDVLTDIRHYADVHGLDFHQALDGSYQVYLEEIQG
jgi:hypothetical protein